MSGFQVVVIYGDRSFDSIRDSERQALHKVAEYMKNDSDSIISAMGNRIQEELVFGREIEVIKGLLIHNDFAILIKYIP